MSLASEGALGAQGYASALDVGGGSVVPSGEIPAEGTAASLSQGGELGSPAPTTRKRLDDELKVALIDAPGGAATLDQVHETVNATVNATPGPHVPRGVIEARFLEWETAGVVRRDGDRWVLGAAARAEVENPEAVVARRGEIVATMALHTVPEFGKLEGVTALELDGFLRATCEDETPGGALTPEGLVAREIPIEVLTSDLEALVAATVLLRRTAAEEAQIRGEVDFPPDEEERDEDTEEGEDEPASVRGPAVDGRPPSYTFAEGVLERLFVLGAVAVARISVPAASAEVSAAVDAAATDGLAFQRRLGAELEAARKTIAGHEQYRARLRTLLASHRLEFLGEQAELPPAPLPPPAVVYFAFTNTVPMNDAELGIILREVEEVERQIAVEEGAIEGAKLSFSSVKTSGKERITELKDRKRELLGESHATSRTYTVEAYVVLDHSGPEVVKITRAKSDNRELKREVLKPAAVLETLARSEVQAAPVPEVPTPTPAASSPAPAPAPTGDAAAVASDLARAAKTVAGEAALAKSNGKVEITVAGLGPYAMAAILGTGDEGLPVTAIGAATAEAAGLPDAPGFTAVARLAGAKLVRDGSVEAREERYFFNVARALLAVVTAAGDSGLRVADLHDRFVEHAKCVLTDAVRIAIDDELDVAVVRDDLSKGPLPGDLGDLLWLAGQTDPRRIEAPKTTAPIGSPPEPKKRGGKGGGGAKVKK